MTPLQIRYRSPDALTAHPRNARRHSAKQIDQIAASISAFGFNAPVLVDREGQILAGHGRVEAARRLGLATIPTVAMEHLTDAEKRAFMLADNQIAGQSTWDLQMLATELEQLTLVDEPFELTDTGFEMPEIDALVESLHKPTAEDPADQDVDPASVERVAQEGDLWLLGKHRLFVGDALDPLSYKVLLGSEKAQMVFIDPPYNCAINGHVSGLGKVRHREFKMASGEMSSSEFMSFLRTAFERLIEVSLDGSIHFVCMDWRQLKALLLAGEVYTETKNICCWVKTAGGMGALYRSQHEFVAVFKAGTARHINNVALGKHGRNRTNVWTMAGMSGFQKDRAEKLSWHPTVKPVGLVADAILDCSNRGGLILDVFGGSGTTAIAAERTGRRVALMELDPLYADVILRRFCDVTGIEPVNAWTGEVVRRRPNAGGAK